MVRQLKLVEGRLVTTLRRTKTSGPNRRIKEMPLCVREAAFFENPAYLKVGFELLQWLATFGRDYLLPKLKPNFAVFQKKILQRAGIPAIAQGARERPLREVEVGGVRYLCPVLWGQGGQAPAKICGGGPRRKPLPHLGRTRGG